MTDIHSELLKNVSDREIKSFSSAGLIKAEYCKDSGKMHSENCEYDPRGSRLEVGYFIKGTIPVNVCDRHVLCDYDVVGEGIATEFCPDENIKAVSLLRINDRHFPKEVIISDADYVYRYTDGTKPLLDDEKYPYYYNYLGEGEYVGRGRGKKQFNCVCREHLSSDGESKEDEVMKNVSRFGRRRRKAS